MTNYELRILLFEAKVLDFGGREYTTPDQLPDQFAAVGAFAALFIAGGHLFEKADGVQALVVEMHEVRHCDRIQIACHQFEKIPIPAFI
jgi:hypothetical protein